MRCILVDDARRRRGRKRGGGVSPARLTIDPEGQRERDPDEVLAVHEALERLAGVDERKAKLVEYRYFAGLSIDETANALELSPRAVDAQWQFARAWLHKQLAGLRGETDTDA